MGRTIIEKILANHSDDDVRPGEIVDIEIDVRAARDFGGASVVKNLRDGRLSISDPDKTCFTFDCNPGGSDQKYASNQQICRIFAREHGIRVFDIDKGIGTHVAIDEGLAVPGATFVSTDSHANILGAIGAFGQGMGDIDIAHAFAHGRVWFKVPETVEVWLNGNPPAGVTPKDLTLAILQKFGAAGLLGYAAEFKGEVVDKLDLAGRITMASMATEMGGIIALFAPNQDVLERCEKASGRKIEPVLADDDATYAKRFDIDVSGLAPMASRPGHPEDVVPLSELGGTKIGSAFIGSCTNGRIEDMRAAAEVLRGKKVAPGVVLKIVPSTDQVWKQCLNEGLFQVFKDAGALVGNAGCGGCAAGQIGQNGPGETTVSSGNRNFVGKQGKGEVFLVSPEVAAASAIAGVIAPPSDIPDRPVLFDTKTGNAPGRSKKTAAAKLAARPTRLRGRVWIIDENNIDTDMIFHNRHLAVTEISEMGKFAFENLDGWRDFPEKVVAGDIIVTGANFGCGSSRQQAVDCFRSLGVSVIVARSFGAIYERNAINCGFPVLSGELLTGGLENGEEIELELTTGVVEFANGDRMKMTPFSKVQRSIYARGGLLK